MVFRGAIMKDERIKQIMCDFGFPNSHSLFYALKQVAIAVACSCATSFARAREYDRHLYMAKGGA